jgi:hypothetical protein
MSNFFDKPRHAAGFHVLIFFINVFIKPHKGLRQGVHGVRRPAITGQAGENPRRTPLIGKRAISGWKLIKHDKPTGLFVDTHQLDDLIIFGNYFSFVKASIIFNITHFKIRI